MGKKNKTTDLGDIFGTIAVEVGDTTLHLRRVLTRAQARTVTEVMSASAVASEESRRVLGLDEDSPPDDLTDEEKAEKLEMIELDLANRIVDGIEAMITNPEEIGLDKNLWSTEALSKVFAGLRDISKNAINESMALHFPSNGSTD